jgi:hypothetical protein
MNECSFARSWSRLHKMQGRLRRSSTRKTTAVVLRVAWVVVSSNCSSRQGTSSDWLNQSLAFDGSDLPSRAERTCKRLLCRYRRLGPSETANDCCAAIDVSGRAKLQTIAVPLFDIRIERNGERLLFRYRRLGPSETANDRCSATGISDRAKLQTIGVPRYRRLGSSEIANDCCSAIDDSGRAKLRTITVPLSTSRVERSANDWCSAIRGPGRA